MHLTNYRADIDGLRAVAVLMVLMFHLGLGVPGGYVGVDVFFVISGFLITGIIKREIEQGEFTFTGFYARRARRILPALLAVLLFSSVAAFFILLPSDLERFARSVVAALSSVSNFWFWSQGGYFGSTAEMAPLLHTWSLAVEEQFYLLLPIAMLLLSRWVPKWGPRVLLAVCVGTFAAAAWFVAARTPEVFYFTPFRAWELLMGSLLAVYRLPTVAHNLSRQWIAAVGLLLVVAPAFLYSRETVFPGPAAALPCVGAALLIWMGATGETLVGKLLQQRALVFVGLISYSLYLWHWPLLVFAKHALGEGLALDLRLAIGLASMLLATLSWRFIETPFRSRTRVNSKRAWSFSLGTTALVSGFVVVVMASHGLEDRFTSEVVNLDRARTREVVRPECIDIRVPLSTDTVCGIGAPGTPTVLVWGDSFAHAMLPAFDAAFAKMGVAALFAAESGCPPLPSARVSFQGRDNWRCREFNEKMVRFAEAQRGVEQVMLAAAWDSYANEHSGYRLRVSGQADSSSSLAQALETLAQELQTMHGIPQLIVFGQVPNYTWSVPHKMLLNKLNGEQITHVTLEDWRTKSAATQVIFEKLTKTKQMIFVDSAGWFCASGACRFASDEGLPLYWDGGHLNMNGARFITPKLEETFRLLLSGSTKPMRQ